MFHLPNLWKSNIVFEKNFVSLKQRFEQLVYGSMFDKTVECLIFTRISDFIPCKIVYRVETSTHKQKKSIIYWTRKNDIVIPSILSSFYKPRQMTKTRQTTKKRYESLRCALRPRNSSFLLSLLLIIPIVFSLSCPISSIFLQFSRSHFLHN